MAVRENVRVASVELVDVAALALSACTESAHVAAPVQPVPRAPTEGSLSDGVLKIVAGLRLRPDIDKICGGGEDFREATRDVVIELAMSGEIEGNPRKDAESAAHILHAHCGQPEAAPASAAGPSAWSGSR